MHRFAWLVAIALVVVACGGGAGPSPTPGSQATTPPGATNAPNGTAQPNTGDNKSRARLLIPPGATQISESTFGNSYSVQLSSTQSLEELGAFWTQAIPAAGLTETGRFTMAGTLTIAFTNPDGGIVASEDASAGGVIMNISVGTS